MTKQQIISALILNARAEGASVKEAVDSILGAGAYDRLVGELYEELRR